MTLPGRSEAAPFVRDPVVLCAVGLLVTVTDIRAFGFDLTDDTIGYGLVALGAWLAGRDEAARARVWWRLTAAGAAVCAVLTLIAFSGPVGRFLVYPAWLWSGVSSGEAIIVATTLAALAVALRGRLPSGSRGRTVLTVGAAAVVLTAIGMVVLLGSGRGYTGVTGAVVQLLGSVDGLTAAILVVLAFLAARQAE